MRVAVDATSIPRNRAGVAHYLVELLKALDPLDPELLVLAKPTDTAGLAELAPSAEIVECSRFLGRPGRIAWEQTGLPLLLRRIQPDLIHAPHYSMPYLSGIPAVVVFHDATFLTMPELHQRVKRVWFRSVMALSKRRAARIITVSHDAKNELKKFGIERIDVVHHGVDNEWFSLAGKERDAIVFVGTLEPRKNLARLVTAYDRVREAGVELELVLAGSRGWHCEELDAAIRRSPHRSDISLPGYISNGEKQALVSSARVFAYPSLAEGFGIPVLEAMAAGTPVVTSNRSATAEVAGNAAITVDPEDTRALADALARAAEEGDTRSCLIQAGPERARKFTWERAAGSTVASWSRALASAHSPN